MNTHPEQYAAYIAIDWADQQHVYSLQVAGQTKKETGTLDQKPEAIDAWLVQLQARFPGQAVAIGLEQSRGALIHALLAYDFVVLYPIHPTTVKKFREAFKSSGAKSDPLDTDQILEILTKHLHLLKPLTPDTSETRLLARLVQDRRKTVELRTAQLQGLTASLKEYFPQARELLSDNLSSRLAVDFLLKWPTLQEAQQIKPATFKKFYYGHNIRSPKLIQAKLKLLAQAKPLTEDAAIVESGRRLTQLYAHLIQTLNPIIEDYAQRIQGVFQGHPEARLFRDIPGAGPALAPRLLVSFGTNRARFATAQDVQKLSGIAPVTKSSGRSKVVYCRAACPKFLRQSFHEFARLSIGRCQWAKNFVDHYTEKGKKYHTIIRALAFKWIRILFRCWQDRTPYDEAKYMAALAKHGSIFATPHPEKKS